MRQKYRWKATENEDEKAQRDEPWIGNSGDLWLIELLSGEYGADVHEASEIKKDIHTRADFIVTFLSFRKKLAVPIQCAASDEGCEEIVCAKRTACSGDEELYRREVLLVLSLKIYVQ